MNLKIFYIGLDYCFVLVFQTKILELFSRSNFILVVCFLISVQFISFGRNKGNFTIKRQKCKAQAKRGRVYDLIVDFNIRFPSGMVNLTIDPVHQIGLIFSKNSTSVFDCKKASSVFDHKCF